MLVGYNTNVPYKGIMYHVQTEDNGTKNPFIVTLLYHKGTILASKKTNYAEFIDSPDYKEKVRALMKEQHKTMIKELIRGKFTGDASEPPPSAGGPKPAEAKTAEGTEASVTQETPEREGHEKGQISKSLDDILLDFIIKREHKAGNPE